VTTKKSKAPPEHPCWEKANKVLAADNTELDMQATITLGSATMGRAMYVPTRKINSRGKKARMVMPTFCPFCGEKL
jgi:ribosomal protein L33